MAQHKILNDLQMATGSTPKGGTAGSVEEYKPFKWGTGAPTGTPDAAVYIRMDAVGEDSRIYTDNSGTWAAADL